MRFFNYIMSMAALLSSAIFFGQPITSQSPANRQPITA